MIRQLTALTLVFAMFSTGCAMKRVERPVLDYYGKGKAPLETAPFKGDYVLYQIPKAGGYVTMFRGPLEPPAKVGFQTATDGSLDAIAGDQNVPLQPGFYSWRATPAENQYDGSRTAQGAGTTVIVILGVAIVVAGVVGLALAL